MRTKIDQQWADSIAFATVYFQGVGNLNAATELLLIYGEAAHEMGESAKDAIGDLADSIARLVRDSSPQHGSYLEFRDLSTGEVVDPDIFVDTEHGRASVWAARVMAAAIGGDIPQCRAVVASLTDNPDVTPGDLGVPLNALMMGAAMILYENNSREAWEALRIQAQTGARATWWVNCYGGTRDRPVLDGIPCLADSYSSSLDRDTAAAQHVLTTRHAIEMRRT